MDSAPGKGPSPQCPTVNQFSLKRRDSVLEYLLFSPGHTPCNLFPKKKRVLRQTHLQSKDKVKAKTAELLNMVTNLVLQCCYEH